MRALTGAIGFSGEMNTHQIIPQPWLREAGNFIYAIGKPGHKNAMHFNVTFDREVPEAQREATMRLLLSAPAMLQLIEDAETGLHADYEEGKPCRCSQCEWRRNVADLLELGGQP